MKQFAILLLITLVTQKIFAQNLDMGTDTVPSKTMDSVFIKSLMKPFAVVPLPTVSGTYMFAGKKSELIELAQIPADITNKTGRQVFSKIPGIFVYDMDGSVNQVNIASRGLDPHRGWEFNTRMNGIITNSDMYGYPANHFSMPLESIGRVELVRGTGSLQYGAQFGGMLNYVSKTGDTSRPISFESINTAGSYNLLSTYNAIGGKVGKLRYYAYFHRKTRDGYRDYEHTDSRAQSIMVAYETKKFSIRAEWSNSAYTYRMAGPLTDSMFHADPTQATRTRNYFNPDIHIPSITATWDITSKTKFQLTTSAVLGKRNSVMFDRPTNIKDSINKETNDYNNRQVDIDHFNSYTAELRFIQECNIGPRHQNAVVAGIQYMNNDLHRTQLGKGTTGSDFDLTLVQPGWGRDLHFKTKNIAVFVENRVQVLKNLFVNVGSRIEIGKTDMSGTIIYYPENAIPVSLNHNFPLFGANISYKPKENMEFFGGISQAYRSMLFKDLIPSSLFEKVDPNIKDARGYNAEIGFRGSKNFLRWDVSAFYMRYDNRFGALAETDSLGVFYSYRTNIGNSITKGLEVFLQADWMLAYHIGLSVFTSTAIMDARYVDANVKSGNNNINIDGNKVETVPPIISRNGASIRIGKFGYSVLYSFTGESYADALNTVDPLKTTGAVGLVPSYGLLDMNASYRFSKNIELRINASNLTNKQYFTKRPSFYPGPGVWPSDGTNISGTIFIRL